MDVYQILDSKSFSDSLTTDEPTSSNTPSGSPTRGPSKRGGQLPLTVFPSIVVLMSVVALLV